MLERGWSLHTFSGLPKLFAKANLVTPYYLSGPFRRTSDGWYSIGGSIGVIHQEFEEIWMEREENQTRDNLLGASLLIANIKELRDLSYVRPEALKDEIGRFAEALNEFLGKMPKNESELVAAFDAPLFCGKPLEHFAGWSNRQKLAEFRGFVGGLRNSPRL